MALKTYQPATVIIREGELGDSIYQVLTGKVATFINYGTDQERKLSELGPGAYFGELAALGSFPRTATVVTCESGATLSEFTEKTMEEAFRENPSMILTLMQQIGRRTADLSAENDEVHKTLNAIRSASAEPENPGILDRARMLVKYFFGSDRNLDKPSVEEKIQARKTESVKEGFCGYVFSCSAGAVIYRENDPAACMYAIHSGSVGIYTGYGTDDQRLVTSLYTNDFFGEIGMLCNVPRTATVAALEDGTTLEIIRPEDLTGLFEKNPLKIRMILDHLIRRLRSLTKEYAGACKELCELRSC